MIGGRGRGNDQRKIIRVNDREEINWEEIIG